MIYKTKQKHVKRRHGQAWVNASGQKSGCVMDDGLEMTETR